MRTFRHIMECVMIVLTLLALLFKDMETATYFLVMAVYFAVSTAREARW